MAIPGLSSLTSIPGLSLTSNPLLSDPLLAATPQSKTITLPPQTEWRFETSFASPPVTVKLLPGTGTAELFGTELADSVAYSFKGAKGAIYTWQGCQLEVTGEVEGDYVAEETPMAIYANVHFALENLRHIAGAAAGGENHRGPRVLIVGPENSGKTSLAKILTSYAIKSGRQPVVVNLDLRQGMLTVPGSMSAATMSSMLDVEEGWGCSPVSGPTSMPVKMPLVYHYGCGSAEENTRSYKALVTRLGLAVRARMDEAGNEVQKSSGVFIDTPGGISAGKGGGYEIITHIISEFDVNVLLVLGSERLYSDLKKKINETQTTIIRLDKSGGCVDRDESYMQQLRQTQIREYFFGYGAINLAPHSVVADFATLAIYKIASTSAAAASSAPSFNIGNNNHNDDDEDDDFYEPSATIAAPSSGQAATSLEKVVPSNVMVNSLLAVTFAQPNASVAQIRDAAVMGYVYVAEVDEMKKKIKLLSPVGGAVPRNAMLWGSFPESVLSLVS